MPDIDAERWRILSPFLDEVLALDEARRAEWLGRLAGRDPGLAAEIEELLAGDAAARREGFLTDRAPPPFPAAGAGATLGAYTLDEPIGVGGMGEVWLAHRSDGRYQGRAAVKILNAWRIRPGLEARFQREGEILARLVHPNIVRLVDAGVSGAGLAYLVLEYVDGQPIDQACDARHLDLTARIRLFLDVLEAVAHAHAHLVVHRDIKPSNVMLSREGRVKLLDFGIGKLMEEATASPSTLTRDGGAALTPEFAAPEQIDGGEVTTATDVFALGGLLYVLLTGRHFSGLQAGTPAEVLRARLQADPRRPSAAVTAPKADRGDEGGATARAAARGTTPNQLRRMLAGDLDNILLKALARDAGKRYPSAAAFADDLRRYLDHQPVTAREGTWPYLAARFLRRHRVPVVLGALAGLSLVAGSTVAAVQAGKARRGRTAALQQMHVAQATNSFTSFLLSSAGASGRPFTTAELLGRGEEALEHQFPADSPMRIHLLLDLATHYHDADDYEAAIRVASRALSLSERKSEPLARARAACLLAYLKAFRGHLDEAQRLMEASRVALAQIEDPALVGSTCLVEDSLVARYRGDLARAIASASRARDLAAADPDAPPDDLATALSALAYAQSEAGRAADANASYEAMLAQISARGVARTDGAAVRLANWAIHLGYSGQVSAATRIAERAAALERDLDPSKGAKPFTLVTLATGLTLMGRWADAKADLDEAEEKARARGMKFALPVVLGARAALLEESGDARRTAAVLTELRRALEAAYPPASPRHFTFFLARGRLALLRAMPDQALRDLDEVLRLIPRKGFFAGPAYRALLSRAEALTALGRLDEAESDAREVVAWAHGQLGGFAHSFRSGQAHRVLGQVMEARGEHEAALREWREAYEHCLDTVGPEAPMTRWVAARLGLPGPTARTR